MSQESSQDAGIRRGKQHQQPAEVESDRDDRVSVSRDTPARHGDRPRARGPRGGPGARPSPRRYAAPLLRILLAAGLRPATTRRGPHEHDHVDHHSAGVPPPRRRLGLLAPRAVVHGGRYTRTAPTHRRAGLTPICPQVTARSFPAGALLMCEDPPSIRGRAALRRRGTPVVTERSSPHLRDPERCADTVRDQVVSAALSGAG